MRYTLALILLMATRVPALAEAGGGAAWSWRHWLDEPVIEVLLALAALCYLVGLRRMLARPHRQWPVGKKRVAAFAGGLAAVFLALLSPIDALAHQTLTMHMLQHLSLMICAAPLFAYSDAHLVLLRSFSLPRRRALGRGVSALPGVKSIARKEAAASIATGQFVITLWVWHAPAAYDWALDNAYVHSCEHLMLLASATFFWRVISTSGDRRLSFGMATLLLSLVGFQGALLSALIMFAPHELYSAYAGNPPDDQALAGVLMCIPASFVYLGSTLWALFRMLGNERTNAH
jgi:cytochrome c oxidase assembly factor CtaG